MAKTETFNFIRIIPRDTDFLLRRIGSRGELFLDKENQTIRFFDGETQGGLTLARSDFSNITAEVLGNAILETGTAFIQYTVTISTDPDGIEAGNKYFLNGSYKPALNFVAGYTYEFNQDDQTNVYFPNENGTTNNQHPLNFSSDDPNGELGEGTAYTTGVTYLLDGVAVTKQQYWDGFEAASTRRVRIKVTTETPSILYYWCQKHLNMGNTITVDVPGTGSGGGDSGASISVSDTAPENPESGNLWFNSDNGNFYVYYDDGDTQQWVQPTVPAPESFSGDFEDLTNTPTTISGYGITDAFDGDYNSLTNIPTSFRGVNIIGDDSTLLVNGSNDTLNTDALSQAGATDGQGLFWSDAESKWVPGEASEVGNFTFTGSSIATSDSSAITINQLTTFSSDVVVQNELTIQGGLNTSGAGTPVLESDSTITLSAASGIYVDAFARTSEIIGNLNAATGVVDHDLDVASVWDHTALSGDFTANFTNVPVSNDKTISIALILNQGASPYIPTAIQIDGVSQTVNYQGGSIYSGNANQIDIVSFTLIRSGNSWTVLSSLTTYA